MNDECEMIATFFGILLGTLVTISGCALLALEIIQLVIAAVFLFPKIKLIVVSFLNRITFVRSTRTWFRKRANQPGKSKGRIIMFEHGARGFTKVSACVGGRVSEHTDARKRGRSRTKTTLVALLIWNLGLAILQLHFQYRYKHARESSLFFRSTMGPARENNSDNTVDLECARLNHQQLSASERARDLVKGSKLTTRKRGRSRTTTISVVLLHFIGRRFSFTFRLGTFEFGASGFAIVSACAGGVVIELGDAHGSNIVVVCSVSKSLS